MEDQQCLRMEPHLGESTLNFSRRRRTLGVNRFEVVGIKSTTGVVPRLKLQSSLDRWRRLFILYNSLFPDR